MRTREYVYYIPAYNDFYVTDHANLIAIKLSSLEKRMKKAILLGEL